MKVEMHLEILRMVPYMVWNQLKLEPQYTWRVYELPDAEDILDQLKKEDLEYDN